MFYKIFLVVFLLLNLLVNTSGQVNVAQILKKGNLQELGMLLNQNPSYQLQVEDCYQIYFFFLEASYNEKLKLYESLGLRRLDQSLSIQTFASRMPEEKITKMFTVLEDFRVRLKEEQQLDKWAFATRIMAKNAYYSVNEYARIGQYCIEFMSVWDELKEPRKIVYALFAGSHFMGVEQNFEKAAEYFFKVANSSEFDENEKKMIYSNLSELFLRKKDFNRALEYGSKVLKSKDKTSILYLQQLTRSGNIYNELGDYVAAEKCFLEAKTLLPPEESLRTNPYARLNYTYVYGGLLGIQLENKNVKKAAIFAKKIEDNLSYLLMQGQGAYMTMNPLFQYYTMIGDTTNYSKLERNLLKLDHIEEFAFLAKTLTIRGDYWFKQKNINRALKLYNDALNLLENKGSNELTIYTQDEPQALVTLTKKLDLLYWKKQHGGSTKDEQDFYETTQQARFLLDQIRQSLTTKEAKQKLLNNAPLIYEYSLEAIWNMYHRSKDDVHLEEMFVLIEKSKAILLSEALNEDLAQSFGGVPDTLRRKEKELVTDIKVYESKLLDAKRKKQLANVTTFQEILLQKRTNLDQLKQHLENAYPKYYELKFQDRIVSIKELQGTLKKEDGTFVSYFMGRRNLYILSVGSQSVDIRLVSLEKKQYNTFAKDILSFKRKLSDVGSIKTFSEKEFQTLSTLSYRLYELLLKPEINDSKKIIISPDGLLHYIPFEVLLTQETKVKGIDFKSLPYLLKEYELSYQYTATLWLELLEKNITSSANAGILGVAATYQQPLMNIPEERMLLRENLIELEGAKNEVYFLKETYKGQYWLEGLATEANFKKSTENYAIIHLALHGLVDSKTPTKSGLVFTENGDTLEDNFLFAYELSSLDLNTNLLVLSACSTGDGTYQNGEGVLSLGRGFMYAGASSIMTTLWQINDQSTQRIMQYFYENLYDGMKKDVALQQAKLTYLNQSNGVFAHPVFWAAYVLIGDAGPVVLDSKHGFKWWWLVALVFVGGIVFGVRKKLS